VLKDAILHAPLNALANFPVLPVHEVPEINRIGAIKFRACDFRWMKQEVTADASVSCALRPKIEGGDVIHRQTQHQIWVKQLAFVMGPR
jgi:hypothetical protein